MTSPHAESGLFDTIAGLPMHPLVVHGAVVLLPLAAIALIVIVLVPRWRGTFGWLTMAGLVVGLGAAFVAKETGEALAARVGQPERHANLGNVLPLVAAVMLVIGLVWFLLDRRRRQRGDQGSAPLISVLGVASIVAALVTLVMTVLVGHSGAEATWAGIISSTSSTSADRESTAPSTAAPSSASSGGAGQGTTYTLADVAQHSSPSDCWTVVDGTVYDVTAWIDQHPGGAASIEGMCGIDATSAFRNQHGNQSRPNNELANFAIGTLSTASAAGAPVTATPVVMTVAPTVKKYTRAQVRKHASPSDCWTIVGRNVYDLTDWIRRHPGGQSAIIGMCGRDATRAFTAQHGGQSAPQAYLAQFRIGRVAAAAAA